MTLIAQITDPHLRDDGAYPCHDPALAMQAAFDSIRAMDLQPDAVVLTGDIIDRTAKSYAHVLPLLREAPVPLLPMPGNHDRPDEFREAFSEWVGFAPGHLSFSRQIGDVLLIALDSNLPDGRCGVDADRLSWLETILASAQCPALLALHHPPFPTYVPHLERAGFENADDLARCVAASAVCRVIAGHSHRGMQTTWAGVPASTAGAIGHGLSLSLTGQNRHQPECVAPCFELHHFKAGQVISHQISLEPFRF